MSSKFDTCKEAVALRVAAKLFGENHLWDDLPNLVPHDHARWRALSRAAVAYAKKVLAGQCIPMEPKERKPLPPDWYTKPCSKGCPPGRCNATDHECVLK